MPLIPKLLISLCQTFLLGRPQQGQEDLERTREACRNVLWALGPKPLTNRMCLWWQVVTTVLTFQVMEEEGYYELIPFEFLHGSSTRPVTHLLELPFIEYLKEDLEFFLELLPQLQVPLETAEKDIEIREWTRALKEDLVDVISVCRLKPSLSD